MITVTQKIDSLRRAVATSCVVAHTQTIERLRKNDLPKKDVLVVARVAGVSAAKKCAELIPYCHPIPIDSIEVTFEVGQDRVGITASVEAIWRTGVEMEALTAATVSALVVYDMLKPVDKELEIVSTKLIKKKGGKSDFKERIPKSFKAAVVVTSDGTHRGTRKDKSGKLIRERLEGYGLSPSYSVLPDDRGAIMEKLKGLCDEEIDLIVTTGGTGLGPRDVTVEATREIMDREVPGIMEAARSYGQRRTPYAMLSRGVAAQRGKTLILNLPGSSNGVGETLNAIFPGVFHSYGMMKGDGH